MKQLLRLAVFYYSSAAALDPKDDAALLGLGMCAAKLGDKPRAVSALTEYVRRHPGDDSAEARDELQHLGGK